MTSLKGRPNVSITSPHTRISRRRLTLVGWVVGLAVVALVFPGSRQAMSAASPPPGGDVTYAKDIAPILQRSCQGCHHPDSIAPMSLMTYEQVRPWAASIKARVSRGPRAGLMPPWYVEKTIGIQHFQNDPSLSEAEIALIGRWVDAGAPMGDAKDLPPALTFNDDTWRIGQPDLIVKSPPVEMQPLSPDWWGVLSETVPTGMKEDRYVAAIQMREVTDLIEGGAGRQTVGGRFIIHHMGFSAEEAGYQVDAESEDGNRTGASQVSGLHEVGRNEDVYDPEAGRLLKAGSKIVFGTMHLHANGRHTKSHLEIGFKFHPVGYKPTKTMRRPASSGGLGNSTNLDIRPMEANQQFQAFTSLQENAKFVAFEPHMHAAGVRMCLDAIYLGADAETLVCVGYDHNWVRIYNFDDDHAPLLPKGTILRITGTFDNSPANRNVADPRNWSGLGHRSIDNMMNHIGLIQGLTDDELWREIDKRKAKLGIKPGQTVIGCPLCGTERRTAAPRQAAQ